MRASCCVSVLPPSTRPRDRTSRTTARPGRSDRCRDGGRSARSSTATTACCRVGRDLVERHVVPLLVEPEPRLAVGAVEHRVADAARQPVDRDRVARQPPRRDAPPTTSSAPTSATAIQSQRLAAREVSGLAPLGSAARCAACSARVRRFAPFFTPRVDERDRRRSRRSARATAGSRNLEARCSPRVTDTRAAA